MEHFFEGDEVYEEQNEAATKFAEMNECKKFLGYGLVNTCMTCKWMEDSECHVLEKYGKAPFAVSTLGRCKHYEKDSDK